MRQGALAQRASVYGRTMGIGPGDRYCSASPFYHTASVTMDATVLALGAAIIPQDWFSVENWGRAGRLGVTHALLVPTMIEMLLAAGALGSAAPKLLQYGAMPIHPDTVRAALVELPTTRFLQIFGQTEFSPITSLSHEDHLRAIDDRPALLRSVGRPVVGTELVIESPDDDGVGQIAVRAVHGFQADADGWRRTGDLGRVDDEGFVYLHGRVNDMIIRGGENIYPVEIEQALRGHLAVLDVAVVGIPDRRFGEVVKAVVVPTDAAAPPDPGELGAHLASLLAHFKLPAKYEFVAELPRNPAGKVLRRRLVDPADPTIEQPI
jgi:acyl-CoA synthetase (AMP-forming)/AMP-acid ligase II